MPQDCFHHRRLVDQGYHPHHILAHQAAQRIGVPDLLDQVAPLFGGQAPRRRRGECGAWNLGPEAAARVGEFGWLRSSYGDCMRAGPVTKSLQRQEDSGGPTASQEPVDSATCLPLAQAGREALIL
jgi:hypothetical protein